MLEEEPPEPAELIALPSPCVRALSTFRDPECPEYPVECPGRQRGGECLATLQRAALDRGVTLLFEIDPRDGVWEIIGERPL